jgi:hypothetical protein
MHKRRAQISITRRRLVTVGRTGLLGLAGVAFVGAAHTGTIPLIGEANQPKGKNGKGKQRHQSHRQKNGPRHHQQKHKGKKGKGHKGDIPLSTGSVLPASLVSEEGGEFSAHMLLPFETFPSEEKLAEAVAKAEELNLFILPTESQVSASSKRAKQSGHSHSRQRNNAHRRRQQH